MERIGIKPGLIEGLSGHSRTTFLGCRSAGQRRGHPGRRESPGQIRYSPGCHRLFDQHLGLQGLHRTFRGQPGARQTSGWPTTCINYDVGNACLGFVNAISSVGLMIDAGVLDYGLIVDGENSREVVEATIDRLRKPDATAESFREQFATLTLGSGAVAMIVCRKDLATSGHAVKGSVTRAATRHSRLCLGQRTYMTADASKVLIFGVELAKKTWELACSTPAQLERCRNRRLHAPSGQPAQYGRTQRKTGTNPGKASPQFSNPGQHRTCGGTHYLEPGRRIRPYSTGPSRCVDGHWQRAQLLDDERWLVANAAPGRQAIVGFTRV